MNETRSPVRRRLRTLALVLGALLLVLVGALLLADRPRPEGQYGSEADVLAHRMLEAVNDAAWQQTGAVRWDFGGRQQHLWDRERQLARVRWQDAEVLLDLTTQEGIARRGGEEVTGAEAEELLAQAWSHWCNDSFWLNPVSKVFDSGTRRSLVDVGDGEQGLLVEYEEGGVTPGDTYLWFVGKDGLPTRWRMWTQILPLGGVEASWQGWITLDSGARVATHHDIFFLDLVLSNVEAAETLAVLESGEDPFAALLEGS